MLAHVASNSDLEGNEVMDILSFPTILPDTIYKVGGIEVLLRLQGEPLHPFS